MCDTIIKAGLLRSTAESPMLKWGNAVGVVFFATVFVIAGTCVAAAQETDAQKSSSTVNLSEAPKAYMDRCYFCHEFKVGPMLRGRGLHPDYIKHVLRNGSRAMPAFRQSEVDDQALAQLTTFLSKLDPSTIGGITATSAIYNVGKGDPQKGKAVFSSSCVPCHGPEGRGNGVAAPALKPPPADFNSPDSKKKAPAELLTTIVDGKPGSSMPSWKSALSKEDIQDVLAYVLTLRK